MIDKRIVIDAIILPSKGLFFLYARKAKKILKINMKRKTKDGINIPISLVNLEFPQGSWLNTGI